MELGLGSEPVPPFGSLYVPELDLFSVISAWMNQSRVFNNEYSFGTVAALYSKTLIEKNQAFLSNMKISGGFNE